MLDEEGNPVELGRGAMGVTYKALDVDLRCPVTLKVISERYLGDESAQLRFLREARAAASVRHPNVASVFHLGKTGGNYFYAMEFVEEQTLESLIRRSGRLEVKLALKSRRRSPPGWLRCTSENSFTGISNQAIREAWRREALRPRKSSTSGWQRRSTNQALRLRFQYPAVLSGRLSSPAPRTLPSRCRYPFGSLLARSDTLGDGNRPCDCLGVLLLR